METWIIIIINVALVVVGFLIKDKLKKIDEGQQANALKIINMSEELSAFKLSIANDISGIKKADAVCRAERSHANNDKIAEIDKTLADHQSQLDSTNKEIIEMKEEMSKRFDEIEQSITDLKDVIDKLPLILSQIIDRLNAQTPKTTPKLDNAKVAEQVTVKKTTKKGK
jgi:uncharacterized coiled-coil protein SlyX